MRTMNMNNNDTITYNNNNDNNNTGGISDIVKEKTRYSNFAGNTYSLTNKKPHNQHKDKYDDSSNRKGR